ncbi:unnamed protein product [Paramecium primaurelia]|uniref:Uncharacterized protein n=1 Tax=Paramecium primaurelia TaxID=5886 RepID=A0A8S1KX66_PARPR|nr:unnamed protein product [Paramecium primaurelia]
MNIEKSSQKHTTSSNSSRSSSKPRSRSRSNSQRRDRKTEKTESTDDKQGSDQNVKIESNLPQSARGKRQVRKIQYQLLTYIKDLPKRPPKCPNYPQQFREVNLVTNNFSVRSKRNGVIVVYSVKFLPFIDPQNNNLKREIIKSQEEALREFLGPFVYYSNTIIGGKESATFNFKLEKPIKFEDQDYYLEIKKVKVINMQDLENPNPIEADKPLMFFNYLIKDFFKNLKYQEHGKTRKFHDISRRQPIPETELSVIPGFAVNFQTNEQGFSFKIDISHRIIRTTTVLQYIDQIWKEQSNKLQKEELRKYVAHVMTKQMVLANYGTYRTYSVDNLLFDQNTAEFSIELADSKGKQQFITMDQYFKQRYNYDIKNKKAPLLVIEDTKTNRKVYLVAELCIMAGIPDNLNEFTRKQIQKECQTNPKDRFEKIKKMLFDLINRQPQTGLTMQKLKEEFGIDINSAPQYVKAKQLRPPNIVFGNQNVMPQGDKENFSFNCNNQSAFIKRYEVRIAIISPFDFDCEEFTQNIHELILKYGIKMGVQTKCHYLSGQRQNYIAEIEQTIMKYVPHTTNMIVIVLNRYMKNCYAPLKKMCMSEKFGVLTQMVSTDSISKQKKGLFSIIQKLAIQMMDKVGNCLWTVQLPQKWPDNTMIVSVIIEKGKFAGMLSSLDKSYSRYYSQMSTKIVEKCLIKDIGDMMKISFLQYKQENGCFPQKIIYFRDGLSDESISHLLQYETREIILAANQLCQFGDQIIIINIQNTNITKLFREERDQYFNAPAGTVVDSEITTKNYEFILVPVYSSRGCPRPILYRVIYDTIKIPMEQLQDFVYGQCYNYQNWTGSIKLPAIVKNCQKMIKFLVEILQTEPINKLRSSFYYL